MPPTCQDVVESLSDFLDGELDEPARRAVELHLDACVSCEELAAELAATVAALRRLGGRGGFRARRGDAGRA